MIDPSVRAVLSSKYSIRMFFMTFGGALVVLLALLVAASVHLPNGWFKESAVGFLGNFAASVAIFILIYAFYIFVTPPGLRNAEVIPLRNMEISDKIVDLPAGAADYWFWGRSGSYFRAEVLPRLDQSARDERRHVAVRVVIPDPDEAGNRLRYMHMKLGLNEPANEQTLTVNVLATIISIASIASRNPYLRAEISMCSSVPVIRYDISTTGALVTRDARNLPAILVNSGNPYYEMFKDAVENELAQGKRLTWDDAKVADLCGSDPFSAEVLSVIKKVPQYDEVIVAEALSMLRKPGHRYAR